MPPDQRALFAGLANEPDQFGLLIPRHTPALGVLAADTGSAILFLELEEPGRLPAEVLRDVKEIAGLVLDGILEIEGDGRFLSGPAAYPAIFDGAADEPEPADQLAELSFDAIRLAQDLPFDDPKALSSWLYGYHRLPVSPAWAHRLPDPQRVEKALGLQRGGLVHQALDDAFILHEMPGWRAWHSSQESITSQEDQPTYKLYISPHPDALREVFAVIVRTLVAAAVPSFKLGRDVFGLLRPDKLVVYLNGRCELEDLANDLASALDGCPAHGVPFTAALTADGLLSWGIDPPRSERIPGWRGVESWRLWVTNHLARSLLRARALGDTDLPLWQFALLRLQLAGVQVENWLPSAALWAASDDAS